ncbi:MAG: 50S ribosomal protein L24 [Thaumarchaeota archaeon]|jgi:large subunit ribosomal protein L24|nr:50S ribosomal protein L24 [Nitrososphaerota archaeon]
MKFGSPVSDELRQKYKKRTLRPRKGDSVKIVRGGFKGIEGKISRVDGQKGKLFIEGVNREKIAGGTALAPIDASKVIITSIDLDDKLRKRKVQGD